MKQCIVKPISVIFHLVFSSSLSSPPTPRITPKEQLSRPLLLLLALPSPSRAESARPVPPIRRSSLLRGGLILSGRFGRRGARTTVTAHMRRPVAATASLASSGPGSRGVLVLGGVAAPATEAALAAVAEIAARRRLVAS